MNEVPYIRTSVDVQLGDIYRNFEIDYDRLITRMRDEGMTDEQIESTSLVVSADRPSEQKNSELAMVTRGLYNARTESIKLYPTHEATVDQMSGLLANIKASAEAMKELDYSTTSTSPDYKQVGRDAEVAELSDRAAETGAKVSGTLYHEVRHRRNDVVAPPEGVRMHNAKILARPVGAYALTLASMSTIGNYLAMNLHLGIIEHIGMSAISCVSAVAVMKKARYTPEKIYEMNPDEVSAREAGEEAPADLVSFQYLSKREIEGRDESRKQREGMSFDVPKLTNLLGDSSTPEKRWWRRLKLPAKNS